MSNQSKFLYEAWTWTLSWSLINWDLNGTIFILKRREKMYFLDHVDLIQHCSLLLCLHLVLKTCWALLKHWLSITLQPNSYGNKQTFKRDTALSITEPRGGLGAWRKKCEIEVVSSSNLVCKQSSWRGVQRNSGFGKSSICSKSSLEYKW